METWVDSIIRDSQTQNKGKNARQIFFKEFDQILKLASRATAKAHFEAELNQLEEIGRAAGLSESELTSRKNTVLWTLSQAA